ncbi:MAG TPA: hypothetical protein PLK13_19850, partial [Xanthobacteraceae bacterium]|nr:hypothetical protein [Xanthobacteraceae bacterium]HQS48329.1 hypothetical protein [Xanthobacteraceae bacterium]
GADRARLDLQDLAPQPPQSLASPPPPQPSPASGRGGAVVFGESDFARRHAPAHPSPEARPGPLHLHPLADGTFARGIGLPFGALEAETFIALIEAAEQAGAREIRLAPGRALLAIGLTQDGAARLERSAATLGLLTDPADPRGFVAACPGAPACASGLLPARALAPQVARALAPLLDGSFEVHVSGCAKGCAHPAPAAVTLVGRKAPPPPDLSPRPVPFPDSPPVDLPPADPPQPHSPPADSPAANSPVGNLPVGNLPAVDFPIALVREGTAEGVALAALSLVALVPTLTRLAAPGRQPGESGAQALSRLLAQAFKERSA